MATYLPIYNLPSSRYGREVIGKELSLDILGWLVRKWVILHEAEHSGFIFQQTVEHHNKPVVVLVGAQSSKPHLPVKSRLMRSYTYI